MSCKSESKENSNNGINISSITGILNILSNAFKIGITPPTMLPPPLVISSGFVRPGLSARKIAARIISRRSEAGLPNGDIFPSGPNSDEVMEVIRAEEMITALITEAIVQVTINAGQQVTGLGVGNLGAPVAVQGTTITQGIGNGVMH